MLDTIPTNCGIYKFFNSKKEILYVGKASNLKSRVSSYFKDTHYDRPHIIPMIPIIAEIQYIVTENEVEALILESALIKKYLPKFNIDLKDGKSFGWIYVSTKDEIPKVKIVRSINKKDYKNGKLFGPYPDGSAIRRVYKYVRGIFPFCNCKNEREELLYSQIGLCPGPNIGKISSEEYKKNISNLVKFLGGNLASPIKKLEKEMKKYSQTKEYEKALEIRDKINDLKYITQHIDIDHLTTEAEYNIKKLAKLKDSNLKLARELGLSEIKRIECYDISNIGGENAYGSMVVARKGEINNSYYRVFKIKSVEGSNDPEMLKEVIERRLTHLEKNDDDISLNEKPDIILIDGGKSQLSKIKHIIPKNIKLIGISKGRRFKRAGQKKKNEYWQFDRVSDNVMQIKIKNDFLLINLRDEAHRFAIKHYRNKHRKKLLEHA